MDLTKNNLKLIQSIFGTIYDLLILVLMILSMVQDGNQNSTG
jgi:hypothetical protein